MRIAIITESFPPDVNGVAHCVVRVADHLTRNGHHPLVIAPETTRPAAPLGDAITSLSARALRREALSQPAGRTRLRSEDPGRAPLGPDSQSPYPVERVPSIPLPGYPTFRIGLPSPRIRRAILDHGAEVVHLASPVALGAWGSHVARAVDLPTVAVYQTDLPAYARAYRLSKATEAFAWKWLRDIHNAAARTLAPSSMTARDLIAHGMNNVRIWGRGVDTERFHPARRDDVLRAGLAPGGELLVGYVGRLATEKRVDLLAGVAALPGVRLIITGGGPEADALRGALPGAVFLGERGGTDLARIYASMDVFVHSGPFETFGQTLQEAAASGLPVVAPAAGGPVDLVDDGVTGFLVTPGDAGALAEPVARLAADPGLRARMGEAARRKVLGRTWASLTGELIDHYAAAIAAARSERELAA